MTSRVGSLVKDVGVYALSEGMLRAASLLTMPLYTRIFAPREYGAIAVITATAAIATQVSSLSAENTYARYYYDDPHVDHARKCTSTWLPAVAALTAVAGAVLFLLAPLLTPYLFDDLAACGWLRWAALGIPLAAVCSLCAHALRNSFRPGLFGALNLLTGFLTIGLSLIGVLILELGPSALVIGPVIALAIMAPIRLWCIRGLLTPMWSTALLHEMAYYGVRMAPATIAMSLIATLDRLMLSHYSSIGEVGLYSVGHSIASVLVLMNLAIGLAWSPHLFSAYQASAKDAAILCARMLPVIIGGFGLTGVILSTFAPEICGLLLGKDYSSAARVIAPLCLVQLLVASWQVLAVGITITKKTHFISIYAALGAMVNALLNWLLIPEYGSVGAAYALVGTFGVISVAYALTAQQLFPLPVPWWIVTVQAGATLGFLLLPDLVLSELGINHRIDAKLAWCIAYLMFAVWLISLSDQGYSRHGRRLVAGWVSRLSGKVAPLGMTEHGNPQ